MADPAVAYTFVSMTTAYAYQVNQNFTDILAGIKSNSTADLGCGTFKVNTVPFASAVVSSVAGVAIAPANITATSNINAANVTAASNINAANVTAVSDIYAARGAITNTFSAGSVQATSCITAATITADDGIFTSATIAGVTPTSAAISALGYSTGSFTIEVSGITDGAGNNRTFTADYIKMGGIVNVFIPAHQGESDSGFDSVEMFITYVMKGFPADITPAATTTADLPFGAVANDVMFNSAIIGIFGDQNWQQSALSCMVLQSVAHQYWPGASATSKGYNRPVVFTYKI